MKSKYILGVDGGGTRTTVNIANFERKVLSEYITGSSNYKSVGKEVAKENINNAIFGAMGKLDEKDCKLVCVSLLMFNLPKGAVK